MSYRIFSEGVDYLTCRISDRKSMIWEALESTYGEEIQYIPIRETPFHLVWNENEGGYFKDCRIFRIKDEIGNKLGLVHQRIKITPGVYQYDDLELQGMFCMMYPQYIEKILDAFHICREKDRIVSRIDYRFDILANSDEISRKFRIGQKDVSTRTNWDLDTWARVSTDRIVKVIYDKKLDILDGEKKEKKDIFGMKPFEIYEKYEGGITRCEYRKLSKDMKDMAESGNGSYYAIREAIRTHAIDEFAKHGICFKNNNRKEIRYEKNAELINPLDIVYERNKKRKKKMYTENMNAYIKHLDAIGEHRQVIEEIYSRYGETILRELSEIHMRALMSDEKFIESLKTEKETMDLIQCARIDYLESEANDRFANNIFDK